MTKAMLKRTEKTLNKIELLGEKMNNQTHYQQQQRNPKPIDEIKNR